MLMVHDMPKQMDNWKHERQCFNYNIIICECMQMRIKSHSEDIYGLEINIAMWF